MNEFDPAGPLPSGTVVLEASAGTGKTHTIATLAARYLAEGRCTIEQLMVVTFSREASRELRSRVRARFTELAAGDELPSDQRERLRAALVGVDKATTMTIHEFCQAMFAGLGVLASQDPRATLIDDAEPLLREIAQDLYLARYAYEEREPPFPFHDIRGRHATEETGALRLAIDALFEPDSPIVPEISDGRVAQRVGFAREVREEATRRKHTQGLMTFDDQLLRLRDNLTDPDTGPASCARLRERFAVVLVDEFQDTDPVQWEILRRAFHGHGPLVLIGDPKQAIYGFRGADVRSYLAACQASDERLTLSTNHRADGPLVEAVDALLEGLALGSGIQVRPVRASHGESRLHYPDGTALRPVRLRVLDDRSPEGRLPAPRQARAGVIADVVAQVQRLLTSGATFGPPGAQRPLEYSDVAVLVRSNRTGREVTEALRRAGVPVAFSGSDSIFTSEAATAWAVLLEAMANPRAAAVRAAMRSAFFGRSLADLARADEDTLGEWTADIRRWERRLAHDGVAALFATVTGETDFTTRVLAAPGGERLMTDVRHLAQLLHEAAQTGQQSAAWLRGWLAEAGASGDGGAERTRRLETDSQAVQVKTIHKAKGLQFPVVLLPDLADRNVRDDEDGRLVFHDETGRRVVDLGGRHAPGRPQRFAAHQLEEAEDSLRTLYVALTRAQSQVVAWWTRTTWNTPASPLHRILFRDRGRAEAEPAYPVDAPPGDGEPKDLAWLREPPGIAVEPVLADTPRALPVRPPGPVELRRRTFERTVDPAWRRTSYTGLTAAAHADGRWLGAAEIAGLVEDEPEPEFVPQAEAPRSPLADLPGGTQFGTLVHALLEDLDPYVQPGNSPVEILAPRLLRLTTELLPRFPLPSVTPEALAEALLPCLVTPLGPLAAGRRLCDLALTDRLAELDFEMPLADAGGITLTELADLLAHHLAPDDPLADYPDRLREPELAGQPLRGFLTGSIDAVLRIRAEDSRFLVVDYKTNRLSPTGDLSVGHYGMDAMAQAMMDSHYPLQALLYCVALHRFLGVRLAGYDPARHLGGVLYLFVRGMAGESETSDTPTGVFAWAPPADLVVAASALLAGKGGSP